MSIYDKLEKLKKNLLANDTDKEKTPIQELAPEILEELERLKKENELLKAENVDLIEEVEKKKKPRRKRNLDEFTILNLYKEFQRTESDLIVLKDSLNDPITAYDLLMSEEDRDIKDSQLKFKLQSHQKNFIRDWSYSQNQVAIMYYGAGSGKTIIMINCAEQFLELNEQSYVYFLTPASLVLNLIKEMIARKIDPRRKNEKGEYVYNFVSYQQLLNSQYDFKENSLLIIDEAHNLRNIKTKTISEKVSARKWNKTDTFGFIGNVIAQNLINMPTRFLRVIMATATLFVNDPTDIEGLLSIGYKKSPMLDFEEDKY